MNVKDPIHWTTKVWDIPANVNLDLALNSAQFVGYELVSVMLVTTQLSAISLVGNEPQTVTVYRCVFRKPNTTEDVQSNKEAFAAASEALARVKGVGLQEKLNGCGGIDPAIDGGPAEAA